MTSNISLVGGDHAIQIGIIERAGQVNIGNDTLQKQGTLKVEIGSSTGSIFNLHASNLQIPPTPRPTPIRSLPRSFELIGRTVEIKTVIDILPSSQPVVFYGIGGIGKSVFLRYLAHDPEIANTFPDGIIHLQPEYYQPASDLLQYLFDAFYECKVLFKPTDFQIRDFLSSALKDKKVLIILDITELKKEDIESLLNNLPDFSFLITVPERHLWNEGKSAPLLGLEINEAIELIARELGRSLSALERAEAEKIGKILEGHPQKILQAIAVGQEEKRPLAAIAVDLARAASTQADWVQQLTERLSQPHRLILALLAALGANIAIGAEALAKITELPNVGDILAELVRRKLVEGENNHFHITSSLANEAQQNLDVTSWMEKSTQFFTSWAFQHQKSPDFILQEANVIMRLMEWALARGNWADVINLGQAIEGTFAVSGQWGRWEKVLKWMLEAGLADKNLLVIAFAFHQLGTRALCLNQLDIARDCLAQALEIRRSMDHRIYAAATEHNLNLIPPPPPSSPPSPSTSAKIPAWIWKGGMSIALLGSIGLLFFSNLPPSAVPEIASPVVIELPNINLKLKPIKLNRNIAKAGDTVEVTVGLDALARSNYQIIIHFERGNLDFWKTLTLDNLVVIKASEQEAIFKLDIPLDLQIEQKEILNISAFYINPFSGDITVPPTVLTIEPTILPKISNLIFSSDTPAPGTTTNLTIELDREAPNGGAEITLTTNKSFVKLPITTVTILAGKKTSEPIPIQIDSELQYSYQDQEEAGIIAKYQGEFPKNIKVNYQKPKLLSPINCLSKEPNQRIYPGDIITCQISLSAPAPRGGVAFLVTNNSGVSASNSRDSNYPGIKSSFPEGAMKTSFEVKAPRAGTFIIKVDAGKNGTEPSNPIQIWNPTPILSSNINCVNKNPNQTEIYIGDIITCKIFLLDPAPRGGVAFHVTNNSGLASDLGSIYPDIRSSFVEGDRDKSFDFKAPRAGTFIIKVDARQNGTRLSKPIQILCHTSECPN